MEISIRDQLEFTVIKFNKKTLIGTETLEFQDSIINVLDRGVNNIVIDLSMVEYVTSWAIGMLVHAFTTATNRNAQFVLEGVAGKVRETLAKVRLDKVFQIR
jgi:anti-anti-sigma factor